MKIFCSGIGGIGLSAYAALQVRNGHTLSGSDRSETALIEELRGQGIAVSNTQDGTAVTKDLDLFVYTEAMPVNAPERVRAKELGIRSISYFEALGELSRDSKVIAVCGTHGKSSTTAMAAKVLVEAGLDPTIVVGTKVPDLEGKNWRKGSSDIFLLEACEYRRDFRFIEPDIILMTNVDGDHFDAFESVEDYRQAFVDFCKSLPEDGVVITHGDDADCMHVATESDRAVIDADILDEPELSVAGKHMRENGKLVMALADQLKIPADKAAASLKGFRGTWRRMEIKGIGMNGATIVDDYAHHPVEIRASLSGLREAYPESRIVCIFQPHTHERTITFYDDFLHAFDAVNILIIPDIYDARSDIENELVDLPKFVADVAKASGKEVIDGKGLAQTKEILKTMLKPGDLAVCMGAGTITNLAGELML